MLRKTFILAAAALFTQLASADVMYSWQQTAHSPSTPDGLHLELVFSDAAVARGSFDLDLMNMCTLAGACDQQQDGLLALRYWYAGPDGAARWNRIDYHLGDEMKDGYQSFSMALSFLPGGQLGGAIAANDGYNDFTMQSDGALFTLLSAHSDEGEGCGFAYPSCGGDQGMLLASAKGATAQDQALPEPAAPAILAIGALAGWFARRRTALKRPRR